MEKITVDSKFNDKEFKKADELGIITPLELEDFIGQPFCTDLLMLAPETNVEGFFENRYSNYLDQAFEDLYIYKITKVGTVGKTIYVEGKSFFPFPEEESTLLVKPFSELTILSKKSNLSGKLDNSDLSIKKPVLDEETFDLIKRKLETLTKKIEEIEKNPARQEEIEEFSKTDAESKNELIKMLNEKYVGYYFVSNMLAYSSLKEIASICEEKIAELKPFIETLVIEYNHPDEDEDEDEDQEENEEHRQQLLNHIVYDLLSHFDIFKISKIFIGFDKMTGKKEILVDFSDRWWYKKLTSSKEFSSLEGGVALKHGVILSPTDEKLIEIKNKLTELYPHVDRILEGQGISPISETNIDKENVEEFKKIKELETKTFEEQLTEEDKNFLNTMGDVEKFNKKVETLTKNYKDFTEYSRSQGQPFEMPSAKTIENQALEEIQKENANNFNKKSSIKIKLNMRKI